MDFFYKYKKIIFSILFLLFSLLLGFILYSVFFSSGSPKTPTDKKTLNTGDFPDAEDGDGNIVSPGNKGNLETTTEPSDIPIESFDVIANGKIAETTLLSEQPGSNFTSGKGGKDIQFYNRIDGKFYQLDKNGNKVPLSEQVFYQVETVAWSNSKDKAIIEYPDGANIVYDFSKDKQITLPKHWKEFEFSPNDEQIVAKSMGLDPGNRWLSVANIDGSNVKNIEPMGSNSDSVYPSWSPNNQTIAVFTEGVDLNRQTLYFVGQNQENFKATVIEGRGFQSIWAPDGKKIVYSVYSTANDMKPMLWTVAAQGDNIGSGRRSLNLETWANKCTFTSNSDLYCAVPQNLEKGAGLFPELADTTTDAIYKININTGLVKLVSVPDDSFTISNIVVSETDKTIFFADKATGLVHKIDM